MLPDPPSAPPRLTESQGKLLRETIRRGAGGYLLLLLPRQARTVDRLLALGLVRAVPAGARSRRLFANEPQASAAAARAPVPSRELARRDDAEIAHSASTIRLCLGGRWVRPVQPEDT